LPSLVGNYLSCALPSFFVGNSLIMYHQNRSMMMYYILLYYLFIFRCITMLCLSMSYIIYHISYIVCVNNILCFYLYIIFAKFNFIYIHIH
jgi:hypothetical protein